MMRFLNYRPGRAKILFTLTRAESRALGTAKPVQQKHHAGTHIQVDGNSPSFQYGNFTGSGPPAIFPTSLRYTN
jgi:hypothetical protein